MARSKRGRGRGPSGGAVTQIIIAVGLLLVCLAIGGGWVWLSMTAERRPALVAETLCPKDGHRSVTVVLLDTSNDIPDVGRRQITTFLQDVAETMPAYGLFEMRVLDPGTPGGRRVFSKCNPGDGSNLSELVANPTAVKKRWADAFRAPLQVALETGLSSSEAQASPLMETIQRVAVDRFDGRAADAIDKRLIVVSDMIQHSAQFSQYRSAITMQAYERSPARKGLATDLHGAEVDVRYIQRQSSRIDSGLHITFWIDWLRQNGASVVRAEKVQGAG